MARFFVARHIFEFEFELITEDLLLRAVERGCVFCKGQVIRQNCAFGEEVFYRYEPGSTWGYMAVTLTESVLQVRLTRQPAIALRCVLSDCFCGRPVKGA